MHDKCSCSKSHDNLAIHTVFAILVVIQREREARRDMTHYNTVDKSSVQ